MTGQFTFSIVADEQTTQKVYRKPGRYTVAAAASFLVAETIARLLSADTSGRFEVIGGSSEMVFEVYANGVREEKR